MHTSVICPCCSENLLHHLNGSRDYWYCPSCREEMPNLDAVKRNKFYHQHQIVSLSSLSLSLDLTRKIVLA